MSFGQTARSSLFRLLLATEIPAARLRLARKVWLSAWDATSARISGTVFTVIHGRKMAANFGYAYPRFAREYTTYNDPLLLIVSLIAKQRRRPLTVVDVGAAIGDTVVLVQANQPDAVARWICIDGDAEFFGYLQANLGDDPSVEMHLTLLSDTAQAMPDLIRTHKGTASAQGDSQSTPTSIDVLLSGQPIDIIKSDTDGWDGRVLAGSTSVLREQKPAVLFEWHPKLYADTNNDPYVPFATLLSCGYQRFAWFNKFGVFDRADQAPSQSAITTLANDCISGKYGDDWHYDVIALHDDEPIDIAALATIPVKPSPF